MKKIDKLVQVSAFVLMTGLIVMVGYLGLTYIDSLDDLPEDSTVLSEKMPVVTELFDRNQGKIGQVFKQRR